MEYLNIKAIIFYHYPDWVSSPILYFFLQPILNIQLYWYSIFGVVGEYMNTGPMGYGLIYKTSNTSSTSVIAWEYIGTYITTIISSLSGSSWVLRPWGGVQNYNEIFCFIFPIFIISILFDTFILSKISQWHRKSKSKKQAKNKMFLVLYSFWRIFLPDFFIIGATFGKMCHMQMTKKQIFILNTFIQFIRCVLIFVVAINVYSH